MRSRIISAQPAVYALNLSAERFAAAQKACSREKTALHEIEPQNANRQVGLICGFKGFSEPEVICSAPPEEECLIFSGVDRRTLDRLTNALKAADVYVPLKAVCTMHNQSWTVCELIEELKKEHSAMNGGQGK